MGLGKLIVDDDAVATLSVCCPKIRVTLAVEQTNHTIIIGVF